MHDERLGMLTPPRPRRDAGFTLIELVVSIAILGLITTAIAAAISISLSQLQASQTRLSESNDVRLVTSTFSSDVAGGVGFETSATTTTASACGAVPRARILLEITGRTFDPDAPPKDPTTALTSTVTTYATATGTDPGTVVIQRLECSSGPAGTATETRTLARGLADGSDPKRPAPAATCTDVSGKTVACDASSAAIVQLTLTPASGESALTTTLTGRRRTS